MADLERKNGREADSSKCRPRTVGIIDIVVVGQRAFILARTAVHSRPFAE
jgi:hypothetical protein